MTKLALISIPAIFILISTISLINFPIILLLFMIVISIIPFLGSIPQSWSLSIYSRQVMHSLIDVVIVSRLYELLSYWYFFLNHKLTLRGFKVVTIVLGLLFLSYLSAARYILYLKFESLPIPYWVYLIFYLSSVGLLLRGFTTLTWFLVPYVMFTYKPNPPIFNMGPEMPSEIPQVPPTNSVAPIEKRFGGLYNKHIHYHQYPNTPPEIPKSFFQKNWGYGIACVGVCLSVFACVQYYKSANAAIEAAYEAKRSADISARQAGLITDDMYYKRHPKDKP